MDPHIDSSDTKDGPESYIQGMYIQGMTPSSLFQTLAPTKTSGDLVDFGEYGYLCGASTQDLIGTGLHRLHVSDTANHNNNLQIITTKSNFIPILNPIIHKTNNNVIHHSLRNKLHLDLK